MSAARGGASREFTEKAVLRTATERAVVGAIGSPSGTRLERTLVQHERLLIMMKKVEPVARLGGKRAAGAAGIIVQGALDQLDPQHRQRPWYQRLGIAALPVSRV